MEQSESSKRDTEIDLPSFSEKELRARLAAQYYKKPDMVRFLLEDNLALKLLLLDKKIIGVEEFEECKKKAAEILRQRIDGFIDERIKNSPVEAKLYRVLLGEEEITMDELEELNQESATQAVSDRQSPCQEE